jgi:uncharacterized protein (DUF169 family)
MLIAIIQESLHLTSLTNLAASITELLGLSIPPVALAFTSERPAGAESASHVPSACTFWVHARDRLLYADANDHRECPVGVLTMGFSLTPEQEPGAMALIQSMCDLKYFRMDEVGALPKAQAGHSGVVYGPLARMPLPPAAVLIVANAYQAMLLAEAADGMALDRPTGLATMGRPACAAIPRAIAAGEPTVSMGCIGARTYVGLSESESVVVIPGAALDAIVARLAEIVNANNALAQFHQGRKAEISG